MENWGWGSGTPIWFSENHRFKTYVTFILFCRFWHVCRSPPMGPHSNRNTPCSLHAKKSMRMEVRRWSKLMSLNGNAHPCQPMSNSKVTLCSTDHQQHCNSCPIWLLSKQLCQPRKFGHEVIREHTQAIYFELGPLSAYIWLYDERKFRRESSYELPLAPKPWKHSTGRNSLVSFQKPPAETEGFQILEQISGYKTHASLMAIWRFPCLAPWVQIFRNMNIFHCTRCFTESCWPMRFLSASCWRQLEKSNNCWW